MTILIQNTTNDVKSICRFSGERITIAPRNFIIFETVSFEETDFWVKQSNSGISKAKGLDVIVDNNKIRAMKKQGNLALVSESAVTYAPLSKSTTDTVQVIEKTEAKNITTVEYPEEDITTTEDVVVESDIDSVDNEINNNSAQELVNNASEADEVIPTEDVIEPINDLERDDTFTEPETITDVEDIDENEDTDEDESITESENSENEAENDLERDESYTEEYLRSLTKNELYVILDDNGISYKQSFNKDTLISLILENCG